jgi:biopolymer transport protein ExbD
MKIALVQRSRVRIEMLPLIDIVFLLLVVFIYAMLSMAVHRGLPVDLPVSATTTIDQEPVLSVTIRAAADAAPTDRVYVDEELVSLDDLATVLAERAKVMHRQGIAEPGVLLFADRSIYYQRLFEVLDRINRAGLTRISLQADVDN